VNAVLVKIGDKKALLLEMKNALGHQLNWLLSPRKPTSSRHLTICVRVDAFIAYPTQTVLEGIGQGFSHPAPFMSITHIVSAESIWKNGRHTSEHRPVGFHRQMSQISPWLSSQEFVLLVRHEVGMQREADRTFKDVPLFAVC
jgi:hypothetical protein